MKLAVLFPNIFDYPFTYESKNFSSLSPGDFVKAPFGKNEITGVIWPHEQKTKKKISHNNIFISCYLIPFFCHRCFRSG
mgnify:CR=1 FL=1